VITPGYPGIGQGEAGVAALRNDPSPLATLGVREVFDHLAEVIDALESKPIIMGHSFGGAFVQLLLDAGYGAAGVSIDGAAVKGVKALPFSSEAITAYKLFPGRSHYTCGEDGWEEVADFALDWALAPTPGGLDQG
jgi:pimeloyl-ACP methyl ester carboxylesterase